MIVDQINPRDVRSFELFYSVTHYPYGQRATHRDHVPLPSVTCHLSVCKLPIGRPVAPDGSRAATLLMPAAARYVLNDLPHDLWTRVSIEFYSDAADGVFKALPD